MIDAVELVAVRLSTDGKYLRLRLRDQNGQKVSLSLPACWLNMLLNAVPRSSFADTVHPLDNWSLERTGNGQDLVLTLHTPEGQAVSFAIKPWQVEGMATIATYGRSAQAPGTRLHGPGSGPVDSWRATAIHLFRYTQYSITTCCVQNKI